MKPTPSINSSSPKRGSVIKHGIGSGTTRIRRDAIASGPGFMMGKAFQDAGFVIPYPQRDMQFDHLPYLLIAPAPTSLPTLKPTRVVGLSRWQLAHLPCMAVCFLVLLLANLACHAQDIEPRRWSHLPLDANFLGVGYAYTNGDITLDPVLQIEDGEFDMDTYALKYIRSFELFDKSARFDITQNYQSGEWSGLQAGLPVSTERDGWDDTTVRFAINLLGAPPLAGKEFVEYRTHAVCETIIGVGLAADLPTGEYLDDKLINLGDNRFAIRPQLGMVHTRGKWTGELTTSVNFFTDNDDFFNGKRLEQDPVFFGQGHLIYNFTPGLWISSSVGYFCGGQSTIDGTTSDDRKSDLGWALSMGIPITRNFGVKLTYIGIRTLTNLGTDTDTFALGCSVMW
jgi:hypothetical protein